MRPDGATGRRRPAGWLALVAAVALAAGMASLQVGSASSLTLAPQKLTTRTETDAPAQQTCTLTASGDSYVSEDVLSQDSNFGTATTLTVESSIAGDERSFATFDLVSCGIPTGTDVVSATLKLYLSTAPTTSRTYDAHRVTQSWTETGVTWTNQPTVAGAATASTATGTTNGVTLTWSVTSDVQSFVDETASNFGWRVADNAEGSVVVLTGTFSAREHATASQRPALEVVFWG